jgi:hypothetical protein
LLGNDCEISKYIKATAEQRLRKQTCFHGNDWTAAMRSGVFCAVCAEML